MNELRMTGFESLTMDEMMAVDGGARITADYISQVATTLGGATWIIGLMGASKLGCAAGAAILAANPVFIAIGGTATLAGIICMYYSNSKRYN